MEPIENTLSADIKNEALMVHLFDVHEGHELTLLEILIALLLAIPCCLAWVIVLSVDHRKKSSLETPRSEVLSRLVKG
jgi:hypothetical protein